MGAYKKLSLRLLLVKTTGCNLVIVYLFFASASDNPPGLRRFFKGVFSFPVYGDSVDGMLQVQPSYHHRINAEKSVHSAKGFWGWLCSALP